MNYMKQVAQLLGVEIGEEFTTKNYDTFKFKLYEDGILATNDCSNGWVESHHFLRYLLTGKDEVVKLPKSILDDVEKEYLCNVIKPFRKKIRYICKRQLHEHDYIDIRYKDSYGEMSMIFPDFKIGAMYKSMELNKRYSLDELGL